MLSACAAPTATLLKKQKPIACARSAWWPGGRTLQNARRTSPLITRSVARTLAPAARNAASNVSGHIAVSGSTRDQALRGRDRAQLLDVLTSDARARAARRSRAAPRDAPGSRAAAGRAAVPRWRRGGPAAPDGRRPMLWRRHAGCEMKATGMVRACGDSGWTRGSIKLASVGSSAITVRSRRVCPARRRPVQARVRGAGRRQRRRGSLGDVVRRNLVDAGFSGPIHFVNVRLDSIAGQPVYRSVLDLPQAPDLAVIVTPAATVPEVIGDCGRKGIRAAVVVSAGFREGGVAGAALERQLRAAGPQARPALPRAEQPRRDPHRHRPQRRLRPGPAGQGSPRRWSRSRARCARR